MSEPSPPPPRESALPGFSSKRSWRLTDQPLYVQFLVAGGIVAVFSALSLLLLLTQLDRQAEASRWLAQTHRVVARLNVMGRDFYRQQTALRKYLGSANPADLATVRERRQFWAQDFRMVRELAGSDGDELALVEAIEAGYREWESFADGLIDAVSSGKGVKIGPELLHEEALLFRDAFLLIDRLIDRENHLLNVRDRDEKTAVQTTFTVVAGINIALLLIFSIVLAKLYFSIARPIGQLSTGIQKYRGGDFSTRVPVSSRSQIGYLEASFNDMAERIEVMVDDLRKLDELKSDFLSTVSHELRTPLTSIGGYVKLLLSEDAGPVTSTQKEFLYIVDTNVVRLTNLINDILDVEKIESGKIQLVREPQDLIEILKECRDTFDILAKQKGLELRYKVPELPVHVIADRSRLVQAFMNLISNAIKYTEKGAVSIEAEQKDYAVLIRIRDTGVGLTPEDQEKLFQKFYRTRSALTSSESGTGLGLVIVRGLVEAHGGTITVESEAGVGTTFTVSLPVENLLSVLVEEVHEAPAGTFEEEEFDWVRNVWVLEKNEVDIEKITQMLEKSGSVFHGYRLRVRAFGRFEDVPMAMNLDDSPVLLIVDAETVGNREDSLVELRKKMAGNVPVLYMGTTIDAVKAFKAGASALLKKPVRKDRFMATVRNLISAKGWKVLVADANTDIRLLIKRALEQRGFKVDDIDRGNQVINRLDQEKYDLVLVDSNLPDIPGVELITVIRGDTRFDGVPLYLISDERDFPAGKEPEAFGADGFVAKSNGIDTVVDAVCHYLENKRHLEARQ